MQEVNRLNNELQSLMNKKNSISRNNYYRNELVRVKHTRRVLGIKVDPYWTEHYKRKFDAARYNNDVALCEQNINSLKQQRAQEIARQEEIRRQQQRAQEIARQEEIRRQQRAQELARQEEIRRQQQRAQEEAQRQQQRAEEERQRAAAEQARLAKLTAK